MMREAMVRALPNDEMQRVQSGSTNEAREVLKALRRCPLESLKPGQLGALKTRPDGTVIDGHHRVRVLRDRGVDVDSLPREIIAKQWLRRCV